MVLLMLLFGTIVEQDLAKPFQHPLEEGENWCEPLLYSYKTSSENKLLIIIIRLATKSSSGFLTWKGICSCLGQPFAPVVYSFVAICDVMD